MNPPTSIPDPGGADVGVAALRRALAAVAILWGVWILVFHFVGNSTLGYVETNSMFGWWFWVNTRGLEAGNLLGVFDQDEAHAWFMPVVAAALIWRERPAVRRLDLRPAWWALGIFLAALLLHFCGYVVQQTRLSVAAFAVGLYALSGFVLGGGWMRLTLFPFGLLLLCVPLGNSAEFITFPLRVFVSKISVGVANGLFGLDVVREGTQLYNSARTFQFDVAPACSGIRSLVALGAIMTVYGYLALESNWRRILMVLAAVPLAVFGNALRIITTIVVAETSGQEAGARIEQNLGFLTFAVALVGALALGKLLQEKSPAAKPAEAKTSPAQANEEVIE